MEPLTRKQGMMLALIRDFIQRRGYPPTIRDLLAMAGDKSIAGVQKILGALEGKGYIRKTPGRSRGIEILFAPRSAQIPVVGMVPAGIPLLAEENIEGHVALSADISPPGSFLLRVQGESMIGDYIQDGDYVLVKPQPIADDGDIVVAELDGEATVKRLRRKNGDISLVPSNPTMDPIPIREGAELRIIGKVVAVFRFLEPGTWRNKGD